MSTVCEYFVMAEYELPSELEITLDEENEKQAIIPHPEENDPKV